MCDVGLSQKLRVPTTTIKERQVEYTTGTHDSVRSTFIRQIYVVQKICLRDNGFESSLLNIIISESSR